MKKAASRRRRLLRNDVGAVLPLLGARVAEVGLKTKLGWEFGKAVTRIHFNPVISTTAGVWRLEGAVISRAVECDEFEDSIADTLERTA